MAEAVGNTGGFAAEAKAIMEAGMQQQLETMQVSTDQKVAADLINVHAEAAKQIRPGG